MTNILETIILQIHNLSLTLLLLPTPFLKMDNNPEQLSVVQESRDRDER